MRKNNSASIIITIAAIALSLFFLKDSYLFYSKAGAVRQAYVAAHPQMLKKIINLGLDLQGGMRIVLEIDQSHLNKKETGDILERAYTVIEKRINGLGVAEPIIQKQGKDRLIVELPGFRDEEAAKGVIGSTAQLEFNLLRDPAELERAVKVIDNVLKGQSVGDTAAAVANDSTALKKKEAEEKAKLLFTGKEKAAAESSAVKIAPSTVSSLSELLVPLDNQIGVAESHKEQVKQILARADVRDALERTGLSGSTFLWGHAARLTGSTKYYELYYVKSHPEMRGDAIKDARGTINQDGMTGGQAYVSLEMNSRGARMFSRVTGQNVDKFLAIVLDSTVYSAPKIRQKIAFGQAMIEGNFTLEEAKNLAVVLRAGALPAPVNIIEQRTVGPSLGQDSIRKGAISWVVAMTLVFLFMAIYYRWSGIIANFAVLIELVLILGLMASVNATLTLPGIAGLVLNIGIAVDANVLIYERIREELRLGKTTRGAIHAGFDRALVTIIDSHVASLITALILFWLGTGPIKGFAITLIFGIIISLFTQFVITRTVFEVMPPKHKDETLSI
ncbi:MAG: protein translocase subunit SecD [Chitinivibrionales bacterium]|nr:protein translocase subunit SecD [Chitinivibrionales bacterium]